VYYLFIIILSQFTVHGKYAWNAARRRKNVNSNLELNCVPKCWAHLPCQNLWGTPGYLELTKHTNPNHAKRQTQQKDPFLAVPLTMMLVCHQHIEDKSNPNDERR
jgi:hypothetical protein